MRWWWIALSAWLAGSVPVSMLCGWWLRRTYARAAAIAGRDVTPVLNLDANARRVAPVPMAQSR